MRSTASVVVVSVNFFHFMFVTSLYWNDLSAKYSRFITQLFFHHFHCKCVKCYCSQVGTFGTESAVRKRGGSRNLPYLNAKPRQIPLLGTYAWTITFLQSDKIVWEDGRKYESIFGKIMRKSVWGEEKGWADSGKQIIQTDYIREKSDRKNRRK